MTKQQLQNIFESPFNWENWRRVMNFVFPEFNFSLVHEDLPIDTKIRTDNAYGIKEHGNAELSDGEKLVLYEVQVKERVKLDRNVKTVRKLISNEVFQGYKIGLSVFHSPDVSKWRFSLVIREFTEAYTIADKKPESYTYVFGEGEKGRTAAERFFQLAQIKDKTLQNLEEAFSVEALSKKFFDQYKEVYLQFVDNIIKNPSKLSLFSGEDREKSARDFVKKMMGRVVFLYFLQKKGWMGCTARWSKGDEQFMQHLFESAEKNDLFYTQYLEPLFFDTLNDKREEQEEDCIIAGNNFGKVPFLNGGLFEKEDRHPTTLTISWDIFNRFFEILNGYNFTIIEDDPDFKEVAVDPEMLGHIFENLLEDNKDKGAFYTPKEIVQYMCQESLTEYLFTKLSEKIKHDEEALKQAIRNFITKQQFVGLNDIHQQADRFILEALHDIKVCDPAIGSGAFPMGILHEIFRMVEFLEEGRDVFSTIWEMNSWNAARVKEKIIQNSIYGVDIEKGAVDIARLRFWLSIIIDEDEPKPLPNLDYKIVVGNSLLSKFEGLVVDIEWDVKGQQANTKTEEFLKKRSQLLKTISSKQLEYFDTEATKRTSLSQEIKDLKIDILINQLEIKIEKEGIKEHPKQHNFPRKSAFVKAQKIYFSTLELQKAIINLKNIRGTERHFNHFDWCLDFPEVLNPLIIDDQSRGFDVVIGNPPYVRVESVNHKEVDIFKKTFSSATGKFDLSSLFFERSISLLKINGFLCFISTYQFLYSSSGLGLRNYLSQRSSLNMDLFSSSDQIFDNATTYTGIFKAIKSESQKVINYSLINKEHLKSFHREYQKISSKNFTSPKVTLGDTEILNNILSDTQVILGKEIGFAKCGVVTSADDVFLLSQSEISENALERELLYPILGSDDLAKWALKEPEEFCIYPYYQTDNKTKLLSKEKLESDYPNTWKYFLKNEKRLRARSQGRKSYERSNDWYKLNRPREKWIYDSRKIIYPGTTKSAKFAYDANGEVFRNARLYAYVLKEYDALLYKYLICILNSFLGDYLISLRCPPKNNGYFEMSTDFLENFPFVIDSNYTSKFSSLYDELILNIDKCNIMTAIEIKINSLVVDLYQLDYEIAKKYIR